MAKRTPKAAPAHASPTAKPPALRPRLIVIGGSLGAFNPLKAILAGLKPGFRACMAIALHRERTSDDTLSRLLQGACELPVREAEDKDPVLEGSVTLAPPGYHLLVDGDHFALTTGEPEQYAKPSINVLFETAADAFGGEVLGVILSGRGSDGAEGLAAIWARGGDALVQDPETAEAQEMPLAALKAVPGARTMAPEETAPFLMRLCRDER